MIEKRLAKQLGHVERRLRSLRLFAKLSLVWLAAGVIGASLFVAAPRLGGLPPWTATVLAAVSALLALLVAWATLRRKSDLVETARRIEACYPELDHKLLAAVAQQQNIPAGGLGYLQTIVIREALAHGQQDGWHVVTPARRNLGISAWHAAALAFFSVVLIGLARQDFAAANVEQTPEEPIAASAGPAFDATIEPGDVELERGTSLLVLARFVGELPADVALAYKPAGGPADRSPMSKSLDDPIFAGRVSDVQTDLTYHVDYAGERSPSYRVTVFEYPELQRADIKLAFPSYTGQPDVLVEDALQVTAVEGTHLTLLAHLNKEVAKAQLIGEDRPAIDLVATAESKHAYTATLPLTKTGRYALQLVDAAGRAGKQPPEFVFTVLPNRRPEIKLVFPSRDVQVSPLEEIGLQASLWDDFGLETYGIVTSLDGQPPQEIALGGHAAAKQRLDVKHLVSFEQLAAQPDQLLSYYFFADDIGPDGKLRRTSSDMFFCEVRSLDEIFRQGESPPGNASQQDGTDADKLLDLQKRVISATWKLLRRETAARPTADFSKDAPVLLEGQQQAIALADDLKAKLKASQSRAHLDAAYQHMGIAAEQLGLATAGPAIPPLTPALAAEQAAYQALLKLRAREHQVARGNPNSKGNGGQRMSGQLSQLELKDSQNRYEERRTADKQEDEAQKETRQVLSRLRELAERQQDLNQRIQEMQSSLEAAQTAQEKEEIRRQLKRLRDEEQQILRDADELRNRMDQPANQQRMAEARQKLDETRSHVRQASEALQAGRTQQAAAAGARAEQKLEQLRDQFRKQAAGRFNDEMREMREDARQLEKKEQQIEGQLAELDQPKNKSLRESSGLAEAREGLEQQHKQLDQLMQRMRKTVEEAESAEPLLSKQLYDTIRQAHQQRPGEALDTARQLLGLGFTKESRRSEAQAKAGIGRIKQGIERAAESVLGDEAEAIRRAQEEVNQLATAIDEEIRHATGSNKPSGGRQPADPSQKSQPADATNSKDANDPNEKPADQPGTRNQADKPRTGKPQDNKDPNATPNKTANDQPNKGQPGKDGTGKSESAGTKSQGTEPANQDNAKGQPGQGKAGQPSKDGQLAQGNQPGKGNQSSQDGKPAKGSQQSKGGRSAGGPGGNERLNILGQSQATSGPLTGEDFRPWADRLRDVEEMLNDPQLRAEAAKIRDRASVMRAEFKRHSQEPNWELVRETISKPLAELRARLVEELLKRQSTDALVPLDRDPVPPSYSEQVRRYYERLGSGK